MKKIVLTYLIAFFLLPPCSSLAQDSEPIKINVRVETFDGIEHLCLEEPDARDMFKMRLTYPKLQLKIDKLEKLLKIKDLEINALEGIKENMLLQKEALEEQNIALQKRLDDTNSFWKSPYLWASIGVLLGVGLTLGVVYGVSGSL